MNIPENKSAMVDDLIPWQFRTDPDLVEIYRFFAENEDDDSEPLKLLFINSDTEDVEFVTNFRFRPAKEIAFAIVMDTVSPNDIERIRQGTLELPAGWDFSTAQRFTRKPARQTTRRKAALTETRAV